MKERESRTDPLLPHDRLQLGSRKLGLTFSNRDVAVRTVTDLAEARAYADYSLTGTIGLNETKGGSVIDQVDDTYFGNSHSAEWERSIQDSQQFYGALLLSFDLNAR